MAFSGALTLTDLNDFISPSQACIKPVEQIKPPQSDVVPGAASTEIRIDATGDYYEVSNEAVTSSGSSGKKLAQAQISLNDCLACSGCITSAESVLITLQSHAEVLQFLQSNPDPPSPEHKIPVLSIAPQSLASLAASLSATSGTPVSVRHVLRRVQAFCKTVLGFAHVWDTTFARHVALLEHVRDFAERMEKHQGQAKLPMLASACPGWICYAEKTHSEVLPFIARTKSPQQVMGTLVKEWMTRQWGTTPDHVYHVSVMPCYDKKLEASRQDFYNDTYSTRDVDCVITTGELELMMRETGWDLTRPVDGEDSPPTPFEDPAFPQLIQHPGTSSGSYLHSIIAFMSTRCPGPTELSVRTIRSANHEEFTLRRSTPAHDGEVIFKGAKCYGFRNLQNVVRKIGREAGVQVGQGAAGRLEGGPRNGRVKRKVAGRGMNGADENKDRSYDYVEIMACPGGCVNGGGQLKPPLTSRYRVDEEGYARDWEENGVRIPDGEGGGLSNVKWGDREWTKRVESAYWADGSAVPAPSPHAIQNHIGPDGLAAKVLIDLCEPTEIKGDMRWAATMDDTAEAKRRALFQTEYRAVESEVIGLAVKW